MLRIQKSKMSGSLIAVFKISAIHSNNPPNDFALKDIQQHYIIQKQSFKRHQQAW